MNGRDAGIALVVGALLAVPLFANSTKEVDQALRKGALPKLDEGKVFAPTGKGLPVEREATRGPVAKANGISYHGGPVMTSAKTIYYIWYGTWTSSSTPVQILPSLASGLGGSSYFNINTT